MNRVTIKDVAQQSGTSIRTVSRVINHDPKVKMLTRLKVQAVIDELGFKVNMFARSLKVMKTNQIVVFIDKRHGMYWGLYHNEFLHELHRAMKSRGYRMVISPSSPESFEEDENDGFYLVKHGMCDGVIMFDPHVGDKRVAYLKELSIPFVMLGQYAAEENISCVDVDNYQVGQLGASTLHESGYERLALLLGSESSVINQERARGFADYGRKHKLQNKCIYGLSDLESVYRKASAEIADHGINAFFVSGDERAVAVYRAVSESGRQIGRDVGILGIDNLKMGEYLFPPLNSIAQPKREMAQAALDLLIDQMQSEHPAYRKWLLSPTLVTRGSLHHIQPQQERN